MTSFYLRWTGVLLVGMLFGGLLYAHYTQHLASLTPEQLLHQMPSGEVRLRGLVKSGSLQGELEQGKAVFELVGERVSVTVQYAGPPPENLRELKTLIVVGRWDPMSNTFYARDLALLPHYGFVTSAYVAGLVPLVIVVFSMARRVNALYEEIKRSTVYQPEATPYVDT
ncbi:MAG: hypothetical protein D6704_00715 [Nitrospirae bacterium]|nr:MAG: hypothetical protein D6704_00715 [Nitrospirota bacterium]